MLFPVGTPHTLVCGHQSALICQHSNDVPIPWAVWPGLSVFWPWEGAEMNAQVILNWGFTPFWIKPFLQLESLGKMCQELSVFWEIKIAGQWPCKDRLIEAQKHRACKIWAMGWDDCWRSIPAEVVYSVLFYSMQFYSDSNYVLFYSIPFHSFTYYALFTFL